jgi:hypothetical protein
MGKSIARTLQSASLVSYLAACVSRRHQSLTLKFCSGPDHPFKVFDSEDVQPVNAHITTIDSTIFSTDLCACVQFVDLVDKDEISEASAAAQAPAVAEGMQE